MWSLIIKEFKLRSKEKRTYIFMLVMPIVVILLLGSVFKRDNSASQIMGAAQVLSGYTVMFAFFIITIMAQAFFKDRDSGMLARLTGTPLRKYEYIMGMWVTNFIVVLFQVTVLFTFGHFYFKISMGNFPALITTTLLLAFTGTTLGLFLIFISQNQQMVMILVQVVVLGGAALGGLWFSADILSPKMQIISKLFPQYWIQKSYLSILGRGASFEDISLNVAVLFLMGVVFSILAYFRYNSFYDKATN